MPRRRKERRIEERRNSKIIDKDTFLYCEDSNNMVYITYCIDCDKKCKFKELTKLLEL